MRAQTTYERSKQSLLEEHRRKIIHHDILVANDEGTAIRQPWKWRAEVGITCILEHLVEFEGKRDQLLRLFLHDQFGYGWCRFDGRASKSCFFSAAHCDDDCFMCFLCCSLTGWVNIMFSCTDTPSVVGQCRGNEKARGVPYPRGVCFFFDAVKTKGRRRCYDTRKSEDYPESWESSRPYIQKECCSRSQGLTLYSRSQGLTPGK